MKLSDEQRQTLDELEQVRRLSQFGVGQALALEYMLQRGRDPRDDQAERDLERVRAVLARKAA